MTTEIQPQEGRAESPTEIDLLYRDLRAGFLDAFGFVPSVGWYAREGSFFGAARTDVSDTGKSFKIVAEVPGIPKEMIEIRVRGTNVEIRAEQTSAKESNGEAFVHRERRQAGYYRALELPEPVVAGQGKAKVVNGVLELDLPKLYPTPSNDEVRVAVE
jgi:HSP20 family molecular chaperone IbpA